MVPSKTYERRIILEILVSMCIIPLYDCAAHETIEQKKQDEKSSSEQNCSNKSKYKTIYHMP